jgi:RimJ/RimL family protein N-acetyltransferase
MRVNTDSTRDEEALLEQHAQVLFHTDLRGRITGVNEPDPEPAPRLYLTRGRRLKLVWFRDDVVETTIERCQSAIDRLPPWDGAVPSSTTFDALRRALGADQSTEEGHGPAFAFPEESPPLDRLVATVVIDQASSYLLSRYFPYTSSILEQRAPVVGVVRDDAVVSACFSARKRPTVSEAGVATDEAYRGQGFAAAAVAGWCNAIRADGGTPLYSTTWDNHASRSVAAKLGLQPYADTLSLP